MISIGEAEKKCEKPCPGFPCLIRLLLTSINGI